MNKDILTRPYKDIHSDFFIRSAFDSRVGLIKRFFCIWLFCFFGISITGCSNEGIKQKSESNLNTETIVSENEMQYSTNRKTEAVSETKEPSDTNQEGKETKMKIQIGDVLFTASFAENSSADRLKEILKEGSITLNMSDYANMEKGADLDITLPQNNELMNTQPGDIILYQGRTLVIYYDTNSWSLTPIAKIDNVDVKELRKALGDKDVTVIFSIEN